MFLLKGGPLHYRTTTREKDRGNRKFKTLRLCSYKETWVYEGQRGRWETSPQPQNLKGGGNSQEADKMKEVFLK